MKQKAKVLITCKTYPQPSTTYRELVCTAGVRDTGEWIRLYPVAFRDQPFEQQFRKFNWISVDIEKNLGDKRPESYKPDLNTIEIIGKVGTSNNWHERKQVLESAGTDIMCDLESKGQDIQSLALIKVREVKSLKAIEVEREWTSKQKSILSQRKLFEKDRKPLEKMPFKFICHFLCEDPECNGHHKAIIDWEIFELFRKMRAKNGDENQAKNSVINKYMNELFSSENDLHFIVGTILKHGSWSILSVFYPKTERQLALF